MNRFIHRTVALIWCCYFFSASQDATAQQYQLYRSLQKAEDLYAVSVTGDSAVSVIIDQSTPEEEQVTIWLSSFIDGLGRSKKLALVDEATTAEVDTIRTTIRGFHELSIALTNLAMDEEVRGLIVIGGEQGVISELPIQVKRIPNLRPVKLRVEMSTISKQVFRKSGNFTFIVSETTSEREVRGLSLRLLNKSMSGAFDPNQILFTDARGDTIDLLRVDPDSPLVHIPAGEKYLVTARVPTLDKGKNFIELEVDAINADLNALPTISATILRKDHWGITMGVIVASIIFVVIFKRQVRLRSDRALIRSKAAKIPVVEAPSGLPTYNPALTRVKQIRKSIMALSKKTVSNFHSYNGQLEKAQLLSSYLRRLYDVGQKFRSHGHFKYRRTIRLYRELLDDLASAPLDEKNRTAIEERIGRMEHLVNDSDAFEEAYAKHVEKELSSFWEVFDPQAFPEKYRSQMVQWTAEAKNEALSGDKPDDVEGADGQQVAMGEGEKSALTVVAREKIYSALKIFWENKNNKELADLIDGYISNNRDIDLLFKLVDNYNWRKVVEHAEKLYFKSPRFTKDGVESYAIINFELSALDEEAVNHYLFKHGLRYEWEVSFERDQEVVDRRECRQDGEYDLREITYMPKVSFYTPDIDRFERLKIGNIELPINNRFKRKQPFLTVKVKVYYNDKLIAGTEEVHRPEGEVSCLCIADPRRLNIRASEHTKVLRSVRKNTILSTIAASVVAIATGFTTYYFTDAFVGTPSDYITLFLWGAGVEQGTSFLTYEKPE